jgi:hypothetical protein
MDWLTNRAVKRIEAKLDQMLATTRKLAESDNENLIKVANLIQQVGEQIRGVEGRIYNAMEAARLAGRKESSPAAESKMDGKSRTIPILPTNVRDWIAEIS